VKITTVEIKDYGPIEDLQLNLGNFDLIFGLNESGKTAIVEVLSYVLFKKSVTSLRYGRPEHVRIDIADDGNIYTLPAKKKGIELPSGDIANLLYVQASESSVYGYKGEASFWDEVKAMLSTIGRGVPFTKLDGEIFKAVGLQPQRVAWTREKQNLIQHDEQRRDELRAYLRTIGEIEKKEVELAQLVDKRESLKQALKTIDTYKKYKLYQELLNVYNTYREQKTSLQEYERYKYEYLTAWQELEAKKKIRLSDEKKLREVKEEIQLLEKEIKELKKKEEFIEEEKFRARISEAQQEIRETSLVYPLIILSAATIVFMLSLLKLVPLIPASVIFTVSIILFVAFLMRRKFARKKRADKEHMLLKAKTMFPEISSLPELADKIAQTNEVKIKKETLLGEKNRLVEHLSSGESLTAIEQALADLRNKTGLAEGADLEDKLKQRRKLETEVSTLSGTIIGIVHERDDKKWERLISEMKTEPPEEKPDIATESDLRDRLADIQETIDELTREIRVFKDVQQTRFRITNDHGVFVEYDELQKRLEKYDLEKRAALAARDILKQMSSEMDEFIHRIIEGDNSLSQYFATVTDRYSRVEIKKKDFVVSDKTGAQFEIQNLSSGTRDQLLLCFRLAALRNMYPGGTFLILDDAFIFADWHRRKKLVQLLKKFIAEGNQILYLTSDDHTRDLFKEYGARVEII
jgi:hypothetical protein